MADAAAVRSIVPASAVESRVPPHDLDAEAAVLSASMNDRDSFDVCSEILQPHHFYSEAHNRMWEACLALADAGTNPDSVTVASWLREHDRLSQAGGMAYITSVINVAPSIGNARSYAESVFGCWQAREAIGICNLYSAKGYSGFGEFGTATDYVDSFAEKVFNLTCAEVRSEIVEIKTVVREVFEDIAKANAAGRTIVGTPTGFVRYDRITSGLHDGELTIIAGRPGMGKTGLALDLVANVAGEPVPDEPGWIYGVIFFSLEMPRKQLAQRMLASQARVELTKIRTGACTPLDWKKLEEASKRLAAKPIFIDDEPAVSVVRLRSRARRKTAEARKSKIKIALVALDYLQLMGTTTEEKDYNNREREVAGFSRGLKQLSKEMSLPVVALAQLNRQPEGRKDRRPVLSDLRESGSVEQDADNVCFVYRDEYYDKESDDRGIAELILAKQRNGPTDTVKVRFDAQYTRFENLHEDGAAAAWTPGVGGSTPEPPAGFFDDGDGGSPPDPRSNPRESLAAEAVQLVVAAITPGMSVVALYRALGDANGMAYEEVEAALGSAVAQKMARVEGAGTDRKLWRST